MKKRIFALLLLPLVFSCNQTSERNETDNSISNDNVLVVYYSATGNTERVANAISNHLGSDSFKLTPKAEYTAEDLNYNDSSSRVSIEHNGDKHCELTTTSVENFERYKYFFLGAPVWWQELSWVVNDFLRDNDFNSKTVIPFATSASSSFQIDSLRELAPAALFLSGKRFSSSVSNDEVTNWVDSLNLV